MTYIDYLNWFNRSAESNALSASAQLLYYKLLDAFNSSGWPENLRVDTVRLMLISKSQKNADYRARDALREAGFVSYQKGRKGKPTLYFLSQKRTGNGTASETGSGTANETQGIRYKTQKKKETSCPEQAPLASVPEEPPVILFPLRDGTEYPVSQQQCREWAELYPAVNVVQQLRSMRGWLDANPQKRKAKGGITRFVNGWLAREQNKGGSAQARGASPDPQGKRSYDIRELEQMAVFHLPKDL